MKTKIFNFIVLDKSGSMHSIANAAIAGVNETIGMIKSTAEKNKDSQEHYFTLMTFCGCEQKFIYDTVGIEEVEPIDRKDFVPCCSTPLHDAIGKSIINLTDKIGEDKDSFAQVTIITDGYENSSKEFSGESIKGMIEHTKKKGWTYAFIGANQDVESVAFSLSINNTLNFEANSSGTKKMFNRLAQAGQSWANKINLCKKQGMDSEETMRCISVDFFEPDK